jgi:A/G-specific adenine glycosylase
MTSPAELTRQEKLSLTRAAAKLTAWFPEAGRDFPWRRCGASTYEQVCVEVLLQRTKAETVAASYAKFFDTFPSWGALANADIAQIETVLRPLGLWKRRASSIQRLASYAVAADGHFPTALAALAEIPAVGQYVANAIRLFQHNKAVPLLDVNMARVIERYLRPRTLADIRYDPWLQSAAHWLVRRNARAVNWAVLDLGGTICRPAAPRCEICPLRKDCSYGRQLLAYRATQQDPQEGPPRP